jgi:hypothetical protein
MLPKLNHADHTDYAYGDNPTDVEYMQDEIPQFDFLQNKWVVGSLGKSYECITMRNLEYPNDFGN